MMRKMCGLKYTAGNECLPKMYRYFFVKNLHEKDKSKVIATRIEKCYIFDDAELPLYLTLVKTIVKRDWTVSVIGKVGELVNDARGISYFEMVDLT